MAFSPHKRDSSGEDRDLETMFGNEGGQGQQAEASLRELIENVPVMMGIVELLPDGSDIRHVYDSPETDRFFGGEPGSTVGKTARELGVDEATVAEWTSRYRESWQLKKPVRFEHRHLTERGEEWLSTVVAPLEPAASGASRFSYVTAEVTERRRSIDALRESERRFRDLADNIDQLAWITDASGSVLWYNRRWFEYTGTTPEEMLGWGWRSVHDPEALPWVLELWRSSLAAEKPFAMEFPLKGADGKFRTFLTRVRPIFGEDGKVERWFGTNTDVSERRAAEERLRESETRLSLALAAADLGTWNADLERGVTHFSGAAAKIFGRGEGAFTLTKEEWLALIHPEDVPKVLESMRTMARRDDTIHDEFRAHMRDGRWRWIESRSLATRDEAGKAIGAIGVFSDITERKEAEAELERKVEERTAQLQASNEALESFTRHVAHDLRGPLRSILLACHLLQDELRSSDAATQDVLVRQERAARRLSLLIDDLLEMARLSRTEAERMRLDMTRMAKELAVEVVAAHPESTVRVEVAEGLSVDADYRLLRSALGNLIENAVKYSPDGGTVRVGQREDGTFSVSDEGIGIEPQYLEKIFEPFERLHSESKFKGTGIGLSNVRQIVRLHGGRVWAESEPGKGSTFLFSLG
jgi:hypothetical protein